MNIRNAYNRRFANWVKCNGRAIRALCWNLPRYLWGDLGEYRQQYTRTSPSLLWHSAIWRSILKYQMPSLRAEIMDGMGEHYGYPRHYCYLLLWWNKRGYAYGIEYKTKGKESDA